MKNKLRARNLARSLISKGKSGFFIVYSGAKGYLFQWVTLLEHLKWWLWIVRITNKESGFVYAPKGIELPDRLCYNSIKRNRMGDYPRLRELGLAILMILSSTYSPLYSLPEGENVLEGSATFDRSQANTLSINVVSDKAIISYNSFSIAGNENVYFNQPSISSAALNRIIGSEASGISGLLSANGIIYLVNPNGINIGSTANLNAAGLIASTLNISNADFLAGRNNFFKDGANAFILNQGNIIVRNGGYVALLSQAVENQGAIQANLGSVVIASGEKMTLALDDLNQISVVIDEGVKERVFGADGKKITSAVKNSGTITANGGKVLLTAKSLHNVFDYAVNNTGIIEAKSLESRNGIIELKGDGAPIVNTGTLKAGTIKVNAAATEFINKGKVTAEIDNTVSASGNIAIQVNNLVQGGLILADKLISIEAQDISFILDYTPLAMEINPVLNTSPAVLIQAPEIRVTAKQFGSNTVPLNIDAALTYINRAQGDINILDSLGIGTSVLLRGPPDGFGAIVYNRNTNLTLQADHVNLVGSAPTYLYGNITFSDFSCRVPAKEIYFEAGKAYTILGEFKIQGAYAQHIKLLSSKEGEYWYIDPQGERNMAYAWVKDSYNLNSQKIMMTESTNRGHSFNWDPTATWTGAVSNLWSEAGNWSGLGGQTPGAGDEVVINLDNAGVALDIGATVNSLTIGGSTSGTGKSSITLTFNGTNSLAVNGAVIVNGPWANNTTNTIAVGSGTLTAGSISFTGRTNTRVAGITVSTGTINVSGNISFPGTQAYSQFTSTGASTLNIGGDLGTGGTFDAGTGTVNFNGTTGQTVRSNYTYHNLTLSGSGTKNPSGNITVNGNLTVSSGATFSPASGELITGSGANNTLDVYGIIEVNNLNFSGNYAGFETVLMRTNSTVDYSKGAAQNVDSGFAYYNLTFSGSGTKTAGGALTVNGDLTTSGSAVFVYGAFTHNFYGNWSINSTAASPITATAGSTINFNAPSTPAVTSLGGSTTKTMPFIDLNISNTSGFILNKNASVSGTLTVTGTTLTNNGTLTVTTALSGNGGLTQGTDAILNISGTLGITTLTATASGNSVDYNGAAQTVKPTSYYNLTLSGSGAKTMTSVTDIAGNLAISGSSTMTGNSAFTVTGTLNYSSSGSTALAASTPISIGKFNQTAGTLNDNGNTITVTGTGASTWAKSGTFTTSGIVAFTGASPEIGASNFNNLTINVGSGNTAALTGTATIAGDLNISSGILDIANYLADRSSAGGTLTVSNGATLKIGSTRTLPANYSTYSLGATSVVEYYGSGQAIAAVSYGHLNLSGSGTKTAGGDLTVNGNLTISGSAAFAGGTSRTHAFYGNWVVDTSAGTPFSFTTANTINFNTPGTPAAASISGSSTATLGFNNVNINNTSGFALNKNVSVSGTLTVTGTTLTNNGTLTVTTALSGNGGLTQSTNAVLNIGGTSGIATLTATASPNTVNYNGTVAQTIKGTTYETLKINNAAGATLDAAATVTTLTIGEVTANSIFDDGGYQITSTGTLNLTRGTFKLGYATFPAFNTINISSGTTVEYTAGGAQTVSTAPSYQNLTFSGAGIKTTASGTLSIAGAWAAGSTTALNTNNTIINLTGDLTGVGDITQGAGAINIGGDWTHSGIFTAGTGGVNYNGTAAQKVRGATYQSLTISGSNTKTLQGNTIVNGDLTVTSGILATSNKTLDIGGNLTLNGTISGSGDITMNGMSKTIDGAGSVTNTGTFTLNGGEKTIQSSANLTFAGPIAVTGITVTNNGTINADNTTANGLNGTGTWINSSNATLNVKGSTPMSNGTLTANANGNTVNYERASAQTVKPTSYYNLTLSGSGAKTMTSVTDIAGNLTISGSATMTGNSAFTVTGTLNYSSSGSTALAASTPISIGKFNQTAGTLNDNGNTITVTGTGASTWAKSGTFTTSGIVAFTGASPEIGASNFNNLTINVGSGNTAALTGNVTVSGTLTLTSGAFTIGGNTLTLNGPAIAGTPGNLSTTSSSSLIFGGTSTGISIPGSVTALNNLTITNANGVTLNSSPTISGTLTLTNGAKFKLTVSAVADTKTYDGTTSSTGTPVVTSGNLLGGDIAAWAQTFSNKNAGTGKTITPSGTVTDGNGGNNYSITFVNNTTGVIIAKALTVTGITAADKVYDGSTTATLNTTSAGLSGVVGLDAVALSTAGIAGVFNDKNVGNDKAVAISGLTISGADSANYSLTQPATTADITPKSLTINAQGVNKVYDDNTTATVTLSGNKIAGDVLTYTYASATFADKSVGIDKAVNVAGISLSGTDAGNYTFDTTASTTADIIPGSASNLVFVQQPTNANAGENIIPSLVVEVRDVWNNICTNDSITTVTLSIGNNPAGGILSGGVTRAVSSGSATFNNLFINKAGMGYALSAQSAGLTSATSNAFNITSIDSDSQSSNALNPSQPAPDLGQVGGIPISTFNTGPVFLYTPLTPAETGAFAAISVAAMPTDGGVPLSTPGASAVRNDGNLDMEGQDSDAQ